MLLPDLSREQRGSLFFVIRQTSTAVSMSTGQVAEHNEGPRLVRAICESRGHIYRLTGVHSAPLARGMGPCGQPARHGKWTG